MAKRGRKIFKSTRKKHPEKSLLQNPTTETSQCVQLNTAPSLSLKVCTCQSKFAKLVSSSSLDETTNDGLDITWNDKSRQLCVCQRGKPISCFEEILNLMPSVDSPVSRQGKLSLGHLIASDDEDEIRLKRKSQKRDLNELQVLLREIKSPSQQQQHTNNSIILRTEPASASKHTTDTCSNATTGKDYLQESDTVIDLLFSDAAILDDLTFSPLPDSHITPTTTNNSSTCTTSRRQAMSITPLSSTVRTPFRKPNVLRKRLVQAPVELNKQGHSVINSIDRQDESTANENIITDHSQLNRDEDLFWTQVADTVSYTTNDVDGDDIDESMVDQLFRDNDFEFSSPRGTIYSQQDIETKRTLAQKKLQQKYKSI